MKKPIEKFILFLAISLFISCSGDSTDPVINLPVDDPKEPELKDFQLVKKVKNLIRSSGEKYGSVETIVEDSVLMYILHKDADDVTTSEERFEYNGNGILSRHLFYKSDELVRVKELSYDDQNRVVKMDQVYPKTPINDQVSTYSYDVDGEVHASHVLANGHSYIQVFKLKDGFIVEELDEAGEFLTSIEISNDNVTYMADQVGGIFYSYEPDGINPMNFYQGLFGEPKFNLALFHENLQDAVEYYSVGLVTERNFQDAGFKQINEYTLNEVGLPMT
ncbi:hypothetical protein, partial [Lutimonas sp.]|uniref:hypothetical protein n=1 Tax=Lutimonas sp. TaxID=1872403 RepID=UPI003D9BAC75